ncbi:MAG TPA: energy-coupling factor ABC transporter permease [Sedimentisphaerales bacterium]|nr:energy-coupling factor ABC transporter permease [Sedimentisphaerales bacterium]
MHMANELLSVPVAAGTAAIAAAGLGFVCRKVRRIITTDKLALMGILGAFVFAAQMVNFQLPAMPGTSGHMVGAVLLAIILGPHMGAIVISSVVIIQCLIFQDGGLLALGCNIINIALVPSYLGYFLYRIVTAGPFSSLRACVGAVLACVIAMQGSAAMVPVQAALSGVLAVPFTTFLITMLGVHLLVGLVEGLITVAVLGYLQQVRPDIVVDSLPGEVRLSKKAVLATLVIFTIVIGAGISLLASDKPDGLEWSYAERPDQPDFESIISNDNPTIAAVDELQTKYSLLPDYSRRSSVIGDTAHTHVGASAGWTSFAGVVGSAVTMALIWLIARVLRKKERLHA